MTQEHIDAAYREAVAKLAGPASTTQSTEERQAFGERLLTEFLRRKNISRVEYMLGVERTAYLERVVDADITVTGVNVTGGSGTFAATVDAGAPVVVPPGESTSITIDFTPAGQNPFSATLDVSHSGANDPLSIPLQGVAGSAPVAFQKSTLGNESSNNPTSLQFGPDGRLYVGQQDGTIKAYTIVRNGPQDYDVTATETINLVKNIPNHNDDGSVDAKRDNGPTGRNDRVCRLP